MLRLWAMVDPQNDDSAMKMAVWWLTWSPDQMLDSVVKTAHRLMQFSLKPKLTTSWYWSPVFCWLSCLSVVSTQSLSTTPVFGNPPITWFLCRMAHSRSVTRTEDLLVTMLISSVTPYHFFKSGIYLWGWFDGGKHSTLTETRVDLWYVMLSQNFGGTKTHNLRMLVACAPPTELFETW